MSEFSLLFRVLLPYILLVSNCLCEMFTHTGIYTFLCSKLQHKKKGVEFNNITTPHILPHSTSSMSGVKLEFKMVHIHCSLGFQTSNSMSWCGVPQQLHGSETPLIVLLHFFHRVTLLLKVRMYAAYV